MNKKIRRVMITILFFIFSILVMVPPICWCKNKISICFNDNIYNYTINNVFDIFSICFGNFEVFIIWFVANSVLILFIIDILFTVKKSKIENNGIKFKSQDGTFGTADWMNYKELTDSFEVGTENGLIVGKIDNQVITLPENTMQNKNVAIFGASGSKKSRRICNS